MIAAWRMNSPLLLLILAFLLLGAKSQVAFCLWSCAGLVTGMAQQIRRPSRQQVPSLLFFLFITGVLISQWRSLDPSHGLYQTMQYFVFACLALTVLRDFPREESMPITAWPVLLGIGTVTAVLTTYQRARHQPAYGMFPINPNFNAVWMAALAGAWISKKDRTTPEKVLAFWLIVLVLLGTSRSAVMALMAGILFAVSQKQSRSKEIAVIGLFTLLILWMSQSWTLTRMNFFENGARLRIWKLAFQGMTDYPLTGYGPGNFEMAYLRHAFPFEEAVRYGRSTIFAHNDYLQVLCELESLPLRFSSSVYIKSSRGGTGSTTPFIFPLKQFLLR